MDAHDLRHVVSDAPRLLVVDGSKLVRKLIGDVLRRELPNADVIACDGLASARAVLETAPVDLVTTALLLPDGDGLALARIVREAGGQSYVPVIVVSGDVQARLESRNLGDDVTDYFDKALGHSALAAFIRGYVQPQPVPGARVLFTDAVMKDVSATSIRRLAAAGRFAELAQLVPDPVAEYIRKYELYRDTNETELNS
jgi:DNA-binding response OmpR family regulator